MEFKKDIEWLTTYCTAVAAGPGGIIYSSLFRLSDNYRLDLRRNLMRDVYTLLDDLEHEIDGFRYQAYENGNGTFLAGLEISIDDGETWTTIADDGCLLNGLDSLEL